MIPSPRWFPTTIQDRAAWYLNFQTQIATLGASLGLTPAEISSIGNDNAIMDFLASTTVALDAYVDGVRTYRRIVTEGDVGDPTPGFPADVSFALPAAVPTGMFERLDGYVKRIRVAPAYTDEIGALLGIIPSSAPEPEGDVVPVLKPEALPGNVVNVKFVRGHWEGIALEMQSDSQTEWTNAGKFLKSPAELNIDPKTGGVPTAVRLCARSSTGITPSDLTRTS